MDEVTPAKLNVAQPRHAGRIHNTVATDPWWLPLLVALMLFSGTMFLRSLS